MASLGRGGAPAAVLVKPDPLSISPVAAHSADADRDFRIGLIELTRVIELYNTRSGTVRTGQYHAVTPPALPTEDGYAPGP